MVAKKVGFFFSDHYGPHYRMLYGIIAFNLNVRKDDETEHLCFSIDIRLDGDILPDAIASLCIFTNISTNVNDLKALP